MGTRDSTFIPRVIAFNAVALCCLACGDDILTPVVTPIKPPCLGLCATALSPTEAIAGSGDLTLSVEFNGFIRGGSKAVVWAPPGGGSTHWLSATVITGSNMTTTIPAELLTSPGLAHVSVWVGDPRDEGVESNALEFTIGLARVNP
jgi:hypothetical protein